MYTCSLFISYVNWMYKLPWLSISHGTVFPCWIFSFATRDNQLPYYLLRLLEYNLYIS
uniref:Uncharacterized protein n=1 Tax=Arundo donax TaxID=35708 RepID=A0A0A9AJ39_ARUDO